MDDSTLMALVSLTGRSMQTKLNITCLVLGFIECFCFAGVIFGWFNLRTILEREHYFGACDALEVSAKHNVSAQINGTESETSHVVSARKTALRDDCSSDSDAMYTLVFTISSSMLNYSSLFTGLFLDIFGTLVCKVIATLLYTGGLILLAISTKDSSWLVFVGFSFLLPIGGYWHFISNVQIGNLFGKWQGTVITLFSGLFDSSSFVLRVFLELYDLGIGMGTLFFSYACLSSVLLLNAVFFLPRTHIPYPLPQDWNRNYKPPSKKETKQSESGHKDDGKDKLETKCDDKDNIAVEDEKQAVFNGIADNADMTANDEQVKVESSFWVECVFTRKFLFHVVFVAVNQLKIYIFLSIVYDFLDTFDLTSDQLDQMGRVFGISQLTGVVWAPIVGLIVDRNKKKGNRSPTDMLSDFALPLFITCVLGSLCSLLLLVPNEANVQYLSFVGQVVLRAFTYGLAFSYIGCNFPSHHMGKLIGILMATAATFSLLQYPLIQSAHLIFDGDFFWMHVLLLLLGILPFAHPLNIWYEMRKVKKQVLTNTISKDIELSDVDKDKNQSTA